MAETANKKRKVDFECRVFNSSWTNDLFPNLHKHALRMASLFGSTYSCEQFFSQMKIAKSKYRSMLTDENLLNELTVTTTNLTVDIDSLCKNKQLRGKVF